MAGVDADGVRQLREPPERAEQTPRRPPRRRPRDRAALRRRRRASRPSGQLARERGRRSAPAGARAYGRRGSRTDPAVDHAPSASGSNGYSGSASGWIATAAPCSSASRPCPETWSAWLCVSRTRTIRTPAGGRRRDERLDRIRRIDGDGLARRDVADEVRRAAEVVVDELPEEHDPKLPPRAARARPRHYSALTVPAARAHERLRTWGPRVFGKVPQTQCVMRKLRFAGARREH